MREVVVIFYERTCVSKSPSGHGAGFAMGKPRKRGRNMRSAAQPAQMGRVSQAELECGVNRGLMNQSACSRSRPVQIAMR